ncbi:MAG: PKD domain-containing protein [Anaerolineae bacterium]|nr:PKD domain-containing protein [Anaerolineae bacterium]
MKKLKFFAVLIVPLMMVLAFNMILAGFSATPAQAKQDVEQLETVLRPSAVISGIDILATDPITGLAISHSTPVDVAEPVFFTATVTGGTEPIYYSWNFGDGTPISYTDTSLIAHTFDLTGAYNIVLSATNFSNRLVTTSLVLTVTDLPEPPPPNVLITYSEPVTYGQPMVFTATVLSGAPPIYFRWEFGDGSNPVNSGTNRRITHTYASPGMYTVILSATNFSPTPLGTASIQLDIPFPAPPDQPKTFLPILFKNQSPPLPPTEADLVCKYALNPLNPKPGELVLITVQIENKGQTEADGFWVDAYFDPDSPPSPSNLGRWQDACGGKNSCTTGIAWGISNNPIEPEGSRILVSRSTEDDPTHGYVPEYTIWNGRLPSPTNTMYIYVDSINNNDGLNDGAVSESNEFNNKCDPVPVIEAIANDVTPAQHGRSNLPAR